MKKTNLILMFLMALTWTACHKDKEMKAKDPVVSNVEMTVTETQARFSWQVDFAGEFQTGVEVSQNEDMNDLRRVEGTIEGDKFAAVVDDLPAGTAFYYRFVVWNKFNSFEQEVKSLSTSPYTITTACVPAGSGTITGEGTYTVGDTCVLRATANADYIFMNWTENGNQVSTEVEYSFVVTGNTNIVANYIMVPTGAIKGLFTINESGDQVFFSQGNLQYHTGDSVWRFAEHQYDIIGNINGLFNEDWIDLFGWGTGDNPTNVSSYDGDYVAFVDWGNNAISNGGDQAGTWHTLSMEKWQYLFNRRPSASTKYGIGNVEGIGGLIILPDNWTCPTSLAFNYGFSNEDGDWSHNSYSASQWQLMQNEGAIFLPAAGVRNFYVGPGGGGGMYWGNNYFGNYWSFSEANDFSGYLLFQTTDLNSVSNYSGFYLGFSVRLVCTTDE